MPEKSPISPPADEREIQQFAEVLHMSFSRPPEISLGFIHRAGIENVRVARRGGRVVGGLFILDLGQWFGGRCVPMAGIAGVAVAPHLRRTGMASLLMRAALEEVRAAGAAISTLYPASVSLYRKYGYELAGSQYHVRLPLGAIGFDDRHPEVRPIEEADLAGVEKLHTRWAAARSGNLRRNDYLWRRVRQHLGEDLRGFLMEDGGDISGYVYYQLDRPADTHHQAMRIADFVADNAAAARRLLSFLGDHRSLVKDAVLLTGPTDPLLTLLSETAYTQQLAHHWMVRVLDVPKALEARGYLPGITAEAHLEIKDDLFPDNSGRYVLTVADGRGQIHAGGQGHLKLNVRALAPLYTAHHTARELQAIGQLDGAPERILDAESLFAAPAPWMRDQF